MTQKAWIAVIVGVLVAVIVLEGQAGAASAEAPRRIVTFKNLDLTTTLGLLTALGVVTASGSTVVHRLEFINALAIMLPLDNIIGALALLLNSAFVLEVSADPLCWLDDITPSLAPLDVHFTSPVPVYGLLGARASSPLLKQAGRLRSQGTGSAFTKQTSSTGLRLGSYAGRGPGGPSALGCDGTGGEGGHPGYRD
jgi:hypothetical protein